MLSKQWLVVHFSIIRGGTLFSYNLHINASRIAHRVMNGGHDVPITKIISRYSKSILNCKRCIKLVDRVYIYDNSVDGADAKLLFRLTDGSLFKVYSDDIPEWALTILE